jgi:hypothetical protein
LRKNTFTPLTRPSQVTRILAKLRGSDADYLCERSAAISLLSVIASLRSNLSFLRLLTVERRDRHVPRDDTWVDRRDRHATLAMTGEEACVAISLFWFGQPRTTEIATFLAMTDRGEIATFLAMTGGLTTEIALSLAMTHRGEIAIPRGHIALRSQQQKGALTRNARAP